MIRLCCFLLQIVTKHQAHHCRNPDGKMSALREISGVAQLLLLLLSFLLTSGRLLAGFVHSFDYLFNAEVSPEEVLSVLKLQEVEERVGGSQ